MNNLSFYGGQKGKNFELSHIFSSAKKAQDDVTDSLNVKCNEYVLIAYGRSGDASFTENANEDSSNNLGYNNATIWQKVFVSMIDPETPEEQILKTDKSLFCYKFITQITNEHDNVLNIVDTYNLYGYLASGVNTIFCNILDENTYTVPDSIPNSVRTIKSFLADAREGQPDLQNNEAIVVNYYSQPYRHFPYTITATITEKDESEMYISLQFSNEFSDNINDENIDIVLKTPTGTVETAQFTYNATNGYECEINSTINNYTINIYYKTELADNQQELQEVLEECLENGTSLTEEVINTIQDTLSSLDKQSKILLNTYKINVDGQVYSLSEVASKEELLNVSAYRKTYLYYENGKDNFVSILLTGDLNGNLIEKYKKSPTHGEVYSALAVNNLLLNIENSRIDTAYQVNIKPYDFHHAYRLGGRAFRGITYNSLLSSSEDGYHVFDINVDEASDSIVIKNDRYNDFKNYIAKNQESVNVYLDLKNIVISNSDEIKEVLEQFVEGQERDMCEIQLKYWHNLSNFIEAYTHVNGSNLLCTIVLKNAPFFTAISLWPDGVSDTVELFEKSFDDYVAATLKIKV